MWRQFVVLLVVCNCYSLASGQEERGNAAPCGGQHNEALTYLYASDVLQRLEPPGDSIMLISLSETGSNSKLGLRISRPPTVIELWRGVPEENLYAFLSRLQDSCLLPPNPYEAIKLVKVQWEKVVLTPDSFQREYRDFSLALADYASNVKTRPSTIRGGQVVLHSTEYRVSYESFGFENSRSNRWTIVPFPTK